MWRKICNFPNEKKREKNVIILQNKNVENVMKFLCRKYFFVCSIMLFNG